VLEAVAHIATPITVQPTTESLAAALVYHQWGHVNQAEFPVGVKIIEDAVDSLLLPAKSPFSANGDFALWSLPKVLATQGGGVVFCKRKEDAEVLRNIRAKRGASALQAILRVKSKTNRIASLYWNGGEAMQGELWAPLRRQVLRRVRTLDALAKERAEVLADVAPELIDNYLASGRLPSNLPMKIPRQWENVWGQNCAVTSGLRSFNQARTNPSTMWTKVAPLPVHVDLSVAELRRLLQAMGLGRSVAASVLA
jgi:putative PLP-dependent aminotransferase (TIGR04422 family)